MTVLCCEGSVLPSFVADKLSKTCQSTPVKQKWTFDMVYALAGLLFAAMAVVSFVGVMPASLVADKLGRKWTIMPSCLGLAGALLLMAVTGSPLSN